MTNLTITAADVAIIEVHEQATAPAAATFSAGAYVRPDTNGKWVTGSAVAGGADVGNTPGIAVKTATVAGEAITVLRKGILYLGAALDALAFDAPVYLSDTEGTLADAQGTVAKIVGHVVAIHADESGAKKALRIDL